MMTGESNAYVHVRVHVMYNVHVRTLVLRRTDYNCTQYNSETGANTHTNKVRTYVRGLEEVFAEIKSPQ